MPVHHTTHAIVGNTLAAMVAALELAKQGKKVVLINPTDAKNVALGGHFSGITSHGELFDIGLVSLEFSSFSQQAGWQDLPSYNPSLRNDVGRFFNVAHDWLSTFIGTHVISTPQMLVGGQWFDDVLSANAFHTFRQLPFANSMRDEMVLFSANAQLHAIKKTSAKIYNTLDYATASIANHGYIFHHKLIAPYLKKVLGISPNEMLARYHRIAWLPMYWPETLKKTLKGERIRLPSSQFSYPSKSSVAALIKKIADLIKKNSNITIVQSGIACIKAMPINTQQNGWQIILNNAMPVACEHLAWSNSPASLLLALNEKPQPVIEKKAALALLFLQIPSDTLCHSASVMNVVDSHYSIYRVTNQSACADNQASFAQRPMTQLIAEFNCDYFNQCYQANVTLTDDQIARYLIKELIEMGIIKTADCKIAAEIKRLPNGFLIPDLAAKTACEKDIAKLEKFYPNITRMGMSSGFFVTSFNDQIVQGLQFAATQKHAELQTHA